MLEAVQYLWHIDLNLGFLVMPSVVCYRKSMEESLEVVTSVVIIVENFVKVRWQCVIVCL